MRFLHRLDNLFEWIEKALAVILLSGLIFLITFNILSRNLFHVSYQRGLEIAPALVLWLALVGATLALKQRRHIRLELVLRFSPPGFRTTAGILTNLFGACVMGILLYASFEFVKNETAMFGGWGWMSIIFPFFFALSLFRYIVRLFPEPLPLNIDKPGVGPDSGGG